MPSKTPISPLIALSLLLLLGSSKTASAVATTTQPPQALSITLNQAELLANLGVNLGTTGNIEQALPLFDRAVQVAQAIPEQAAKIRALSAIALNLAQVGQTKRSEQLFNQALQLTKQTNSEFSQYEQEVALRDITIQLAQAGQIERALLLVKTIAANFRKAEALNQIAANLANKGQPQQAKQLLLEALQLARGITGDYAYEANGSCANYKFEILSKIAANLSLLSQLDTAFQVAGSIYGCSSASGESSNDYQAWAFVGILGNLAKVEQVTLTWNSAQKMQNPAEKAITWSAIALKLADMGEIPLALSIAKKLAQDIPSPNKIDSGGTLRTFVVRESSLKDIAIKFAQKQQFDAAMQVVQGMAQSKSAPTSDFLPHPSIKDTTLTEIAYQLAIAGQSSQAMQLANSIPDTEAKALAVIAIAKALQTTGQQAQSLQLLKNIPLPPIPKQPNDYEGYQPLSHIAVALVSLGQTERALQMAQSISNDLVKETTLTDIATQLAELGQIEPALKLVNTLKGEGSRATVYNKIGYKLVELGQLEQAFQIASSLPGSPSSLQGSEKDQLLAIIADNYTRKGQQKQALQASETIEDSELKVKTITTLATKLAQ